MPKCFLACTEYFLTLSTLIHLVVIWRLPNAGVKSSSFLATRRQQPWRRVVGVVQGDVDDPVPN
jgi:hypothetical protein